MKTLPHLPIGIAMFGDCGANIGVEVLKQLALQEQRYGRTGIMKYVNAMAANTNLPSLEAIDPRDDIKKILLGPKATGNSLGSGNDTNVAKAAWNESCHLVEEWYKPQFIVINIGGAGKSTGFTAMPLAAEMARSMGKCVMSVIAEPCRQEAVRWTKIVKAQGLINQMIADGYRILHIQNQVAMQNDELSVQEAYRTLNPHVAYAIAAMIRFLGSGMTNTDFNDFLRVINGGGRIYIGHYQFPVSKLGQELRSAALKCKENPCFEFDKKKLAASLRIIEGNLKAKTLGQVYETVDSADENQDFEPFYVYRENGGDQVFITEINAEQGVMVENVPPIRFPDLVEVILDDAVRDQGIEDSEGALEARPFPVETRTSGNGSDAAPVPVARKFAYSNLREFLSKLAKGDQQTTDLATSGPHLVEFATSLKQTTIRPELQRLKKVMGLLSPAWQSELLRLHQEQVTLTEKLMKYDPAEAKLIEVPLAELPAKLKEMLNWGSPGSESAANVDARVKDEIQQRLEIMDLWGESALATFRTTPRLQSQSIFGTVVSQVKSLTRKS